MIRRLLLPLFLSMALPVAAGAGDVPAASLAVAVNDAEQVHVHPAPAQGREQAAPANINDGKVAVTRSDGSTGRSKVPDPKEIRKLVGYMRDGMRRADQSDKQRVTKRVIQYRPARSRR